MEVRPFAETASKNHGRERCRGGSSQKSLALVERYGPGSILGEAHAAGVQGPAGREIAVETESRNILPLVVHTAGKLSRAQVAEQPCLKEHLIIHVRTFSFTTVISPYNAEQIGPALRLAQTMNRERKAQRLWSGLLPRGWDTPRSAAYLQTQGFALRADRAQPVPHGSACVRFSLTSGISDDELVRLESSLNSWREQQSRSAAVVRA